MIYIFIFVLHNIVSYLYPKIKNIVSYQIAKNICSNACLNPCNFLMCMNFITKKWLSICGIQFVPVLLSGLKFILIFFKRDILSSNPLALFFTKNPFTLESI
jgi:hypothetical protein